MLIDEDKRHGDIAAGILADNEIRDRAREQCGDPGEKILLFLR